MSGEPSVGAAKAAFEYLTVVDEDDVPVPLKNWEVHHLAVAMDAFAEAARREGYEAAREQAAKICDARSKKAAEHRCPQYESCIWCERGNACENDADDIRAMQPEEKQQ